MELQFYDEVFKERVTAYQLTEAHLMYTMHPLDCLQLAEVDQDRACILAIEENRIVTFFVLHKNAGVKPYSHNAKAILLRGFSTDAREQGKGYAKKALTLLPMFVQRHYPEIDEIVLAVNIQNEAAQALYKKCDYVDKGERRMGPKGELIIMSYDL